MNRLMARNAAQTGRVKNTEKFWFEMLSARRKLVSMMPDRIMARSRGASGKRALVMM